MTLTAGTRLDRYEITGLIGRGAMGEVYRDIGQEPIRLEARQDNTLVGVCQVLVAMGDVERLGARLREGRISLCVDLALTHTADDHAWPRRVAPGRANQPFHVGP